ncbi:pex15p [Saccharomyces arboricola H-6]|uniref:Pex15p n=1 Tax=Saccharomyces arboricola (strain H-6 / AS 2.3317 / CBS 10644) TaxID=1160507 RepID=J8PI53_SACAR|nr:pex15p [Saccharomyces arboricola H-6]
MAASEIMNNVPTYALDSSLRDLLNDDLFNKNDETTNSRNDEINEIFQECLNFFIKREINNCLEKMSEAGFIDLAVFKANSMILDLFISACDIVPNLNELGLTLKGEILNAFTLDDPRCIEIQKIIFKDLNKLLVINKFFRCCIKVIQLNEDDCMKREGYILEIESIISNFIFSYTTKMRTTVDIFGLQELIEIFILQVKVRLEHKKLSEKLYWTLCKTSTSLSPTLQGLYLSKDVSIENAVLASINNKLQKDKMKYKDKQKGVKQKLHHFQEPLLHDDSKEQSMVENEPNQRNSTDGVVDYSGTIPHKAKNDITVFTGSFWTALKHHFTGKLLNKNGLLLGGLLLILCVKRYKSLMAIFRHVPTAFRSVYPHIVGLLKLLASI